MPQVIQAIGQKCFGNSDTSVIYQHIATVPEMHSAEQTLGASTDVGTSLLSQKKTTRQQDPTVQCVPSHPSR